MSKQIKYIGTFEEEIHSKKSSNKKELTINDKETFKINTRNNQLAKFISSTKKTFINKKIVCIILIILAIYCFKPITFLKNKLDEKRNYYAAQNNSLNYSSIEIVEKIKYDIGIEYYSNCKNSLFYPADGIITCQYDLGHKGIDIACYTPNDTIFASANGTVVDTGYSKKYGNYILIEHNINGVTLYTYYANLSNISVSKNQYIYLNEPIGNEGGNPNKAGGLIDSSGHHLHFEVRKSTSDSSGLNPYIFLH